MSSGVGVGVLSACAWLACLPPGGIFPVLVAVRFRLGPAALPRRVMARMSPARERSHQLRLNCRERNVCLAGNVVTCGPC
jgi:hypothetical protein